MNEMYNNTYKIFEKRYRLSMTRHEARVAVFALIFEGLFRSDESSEAIYSAAVTDRGLASNKYVRETYFGASEKFELLDETISEYATNWKVDRMSRTAKAILRLAAFEIMFSEIPPKVAINEAVEIAKEYADDTEASFVNGILNKLAKDKGIIQADENVD